MKKQQRSVAPLLAAALGSWGCASEYPELFAELPPSMPMAAGEAPPEPAMAEPGTATEPAQLEMPAPIDELPSIVPPSPEEPSRVDEPTPVEPAPPTEGTTPPAVVTVSPADGASGVRDDATIVVQFSASMNRERTEAAYSSDSMPRDTVTFSWNDDGTELTVLPTQRLEYAVGTDPANVEARRYGFAISTAAVDVDGRPLAAPREFSFSVLRQIDQSLFPRQLRDETGNFRSNDSYGNATCQRSQTTICVGDSFVDGGEQQYRGFLTFDVSSLPLEIAELTRAELELELSDIVNDPFANLGGLVLEHVDFAVIGLEAFASAPISDLGTIAAAGALGSVISSDVSSAVAADRNEGGVTQYRIRFEGVTDNDDTSDIIVLDWGAQRLVVSYLIP